MRKKFKKRLLGIILTILMVVSVIPVQQVQPVKAASNESNNVGQTFYLDASKSLGGNYWDTDTTITVEIYKYGTNVVYKSQTMTKVSDATNNHLWSITLPCNTWKMYVYRTNWRSDNFTWELHRNDNDETKNLVKVTDWKNSYEWGGTYTPQPETNTGTYYAKADLVDYFNDSRIDAGDTSGYSSNNQGNTLGDRNEGNGVAFSYFNSMISNKFGKDSRTIPLYVGSLLFTNNRVGRSTTGGSVYEPLSRWNSTANVALAYHNQDGKENLNLTASVQGLVQDTLGTGDALMGLDGKELPFFSKKFAESNDAIIGNQPVMQYFSDYQFPFTESTENSVTTYSYDSASDKAVYIDWANSDNKKLKQSDSHIYNNDGSKGYYPFNKEDDADNKAKRNFGFGTKFTIPFTINDNGTINGQENGEPIKFDFTGDDDVWVFLDGKLILDMGGAHAMATGSIDFKNLTATVDNAAKATTGTEQMSDKPSNEITSYQNQSLENYVWNNATERSTVSSAKETLNFADKYGEKYADTFKDPSKVHTLTMFYMERGMHDSNMKIQFTISPLPSGLSVSKQVDTKNVNKGLQTAVADKDTFNFEMKKGTSEENLENVSGVNYSFYDGKTTHDRQVGRDGKITLKDKQYASSFENDDETDAFEPGDYFNITETADDNYETRWYVTDLDKTEEEQKTPVYSGNDKVAKFNFGKDEGQFSKANYNVNFINTPKTGTLTLTKNYTGTAPDGAKFGFKVLVDLNGGENYSAYNLAYTSNKSSTETTETATAGQLQLSAGETVTFEGIPAGATYQITEDTPADTDIWERDETQDKDLTGRITPGGKAEASVTNKTHSEVIDKVIYVEAKKDTLYRPEEVTSDYEVKLLTNGLNYNKTKGFNAPTPNEKYTASYTGKNAKGDVSGTITVYSYAVSNDVYVFDYGLKSDLADTTHGVGMFQNDNLFNQNVEGGTAKFTALNTEKLTQSTITGTTGTELTQLTDDEGNKLPGAKLSEQEKVEFNPTAFMDKQETASYETTVLGKDKTKVETAEDGVVMSADVTVMPANVVYYEDNFNAGSTNTDGTAKIVYSGTTSTEGTSVELTQSNGQTEQYGHDDAYTTGTGDSAGSSTKMTADGYNTTASFTFKGTGFDIIARTSDTAGIVCIIEKKNGEKFDLVKTVSVDTYYANGDLYQIPVIHEEGLDYGTYQITLGVKATTKSSVVYLDGVRIYNPMGTTGDSNYIANEKNVTITKIGDLVIGPNADITESCIKNKETGETITSQTIEGAKAALLTYGEKLAFAAMGATRVENNETQGAGITKSLLTYLHAGPNNEMYLDDNAMIAFVANGTPGADSTIQIEAKLSNTDNSGAVAQDASLPLQIWNGENDDVEEIATVSSSTAMYYKIPVENCIKLADNKYLVVILGNIDAFDGNVCLSFTNLKYKGYTITNPLEDNEIVGTYIETESATQEKVFVSVDKLNLTRRQWYTANHAVVLSKDVFGTEEPKFTMYYVNANGKKTAISVKTTKDSSVENKYWLTFKAPNAIGNFPVQIRYVVNGVESEEYISTTMNVKR